jgi:hypothetical protein
MVICSYPFDELVIVGDLDLMRSVRLPDEADSILIVDSDAVLTSSSPLECLQPVARRNAKVVESEASLDLIQFAKCYGRYGRPATAGTSLI